MTPPEQPPESRESTAFPWVAFAGAVTLLGVRLFLRRQGLQGNEYDVLPFALHSVLPGWLHNDWYLSLSIGYRRLFDLIFGPLAAVTSLTTAGVLGRALSAVLYTWGLLRLFRSLDLPVLLVVPFVGLWTICQSVFAGEWMIGGTEAKVFAYVAIVFALGFLVDRRYKAAVLCLGLATSFHALVGAYATATAAIAVWLVRRPDWRRLLRWSPWGALTGVFGLYAIGRYAVATLSEPTAVTRLGWRIYVTFRVPHHTMPHFATHNAVSAIACLVIIFALSRTRNERLRFLTAFALSTLVFVVAGVVLMLIHRPSLLRYYWFRFPDTIVPFTTAVATVALVRRAVVRVEKTSLRRLARPLAGLGFAGMMMIPIVNLPKAPRPDPDAALYSWIRRETDPSAVFLAGPLSARFYAKARRARVVSFFLSPQDPVSVIAWYRRLPDITGGRAPTKTGFNSLGQLAAGYASLSDAQLRALGARYGAEFAIVPNNRPHALPVVFRGRHRNVVVIGRAARLEP